MTTPLVNPVLAQPANATANISSHMFAGGIPDEATTTNDTTVPPAPPTSAALLGLCTGNPTPPSSPTADPLADLDPGETPNETGESTPPPVLLASPTAANGNFDSNGAIRPILVTAGKNVFNFDGTSENFINEAVLTYWEAVPGGERWIEMMCSYRALVRLPRAKWVSSWYCLFSR